MRIFIRNFTQVSLILSTVGANRRRNDGTRMQIDHQIQRACFSAAYFQEEGRQGASEHEAIAHEMDRRCQYFMTQSRALMEINNQIYRNIGHFDIFSCTTGMMRYLFERAYMFITDGRISTIFERQRITIRAKAIVARRQF